MFNDEVKFKGGLVNMLMMKDEEGVICYTALFLVYFFPVFTVYIFWLIMKNSFETEEDM